MLGTKPAHDIGQGPDPTLLDFLIPQRKDPEQCQLFPRLLIRRHIHQHGPGLAVLGDEHWLACFCHLREHFRRIGLEVTDGFDLG